MILAVKAVSTGAKQGIRATIPAERVIDDVTLEDDGRLARHSLASAIDAVLEIVRELKAAHAEDNGGTALLELTFTAEHLDPDGGPARVLDELELFLQAVCHHELYPRMLAYVGATAQGKSGSRIWRDSETPAGTEAITLLVQQSPDYIDAYIDFLRSSDLDHEVNQPSDIWDVIARYGWCEATCRLIVARAVSCHGQHGDEQLAKSLDAGLRAYLAEPGHLEALGDLLVGELAEWSHPLHLRYLELPFDDYWTSIQTWVKAFEPILGEAHLATVRANTEAMWRARRAQPRP